MNISVANENKKAASGAPVITSEDIKDLSQAVDKSKISMPLVAVYCGSRAGNNPIYIESAYELGHALADNGMGLVYGGASIGLMGAVADAVIKAGAEVVGVIPSFILERELAHDNLTELYLTDTMHTRKAIMAEYADAFIALPGGLGTLEEIMEIATWRQLFQHEKPMIILNINNYYTRLIDHLKLSVQEGFVSKSDLELLLVCNNVKDAISELQRSILIKDNFHPDKI